MNRKTKNRLIIGLFTLNCVLIAIVASSRFGFDATDKILDKAQAQPAAGAGLSTASQRRTEIVAASEKFSPSVVSIGANRDTLVLAPGSWMFPDLFEVRRSAQKIPYLGSGVIVDPNGIIVTNYHVVENMKDVFVTLTDGRELSGKVLDADVALDIALIKVEEKNLPAAKLGDSNDLMVGEWVLAMGNPFGSVIGDPSPTVTVGVVSALKRNFRPSHDLQKVYLDMIQTDAAINPGNSGGALINTAGELVGINTFIVSRSGGAEGIGFAIPVNRIKSVINEITGYGHIRSRLMDFQVIDLNSGLAKTLDTKAKTGAVVASVSDGGPAEEIGLRPGDVITRINGQQVRDADELKLKIWSNQVGSKFNLNVDRGGKEKEFVYVLVEPDKK